MRTEEPISSSHFAEFLPHSPILSPPRIEVNNLDPLTEPLPGAPLQEQDGKSVDLPPELFDWESWEDHSSLSFAQINVPVQIQFQSAESLADHSTTKVSPGEKSPSATEKKTIAESNDRERGLKTPPERVLEDIPENSISLSSRDNFGDACNFLPGGIGVIGEGNLQPSQSEAAATRKDTGEGKRFEVISPTFPSLSHEKVKESIDFFQTRANGFFHRALSRSQAYEEMMKGILRDKDLPEELFYLALIESGFNPEAFSRAKACGIWQFMGKTAKRFGLKVDKWVDERRDPEKSTHAAAQYLKDLHQMFNDWDLVAASYNAGEAKVLRAMKKAKSQDFWEISKHRYLKKETKEYVPMFLAAVLIASEPYKYGFSSLDYHAPLLYEKVFVPPSTTLRLIAKAVQTDEAEIQALNPALKKGKTPPNCSQFEVKIPAGKKEFFEKNFRVLTRKIAHKTKVHRIRRGDSLDGIAKKYRVPLQDLCQVNGLTPRDRLKPGSILYLPR